jgi:ribosomal peptide maturation radical SAM protein 1
MTLDVLLCSAPVMSVVRPSVALGLLQAGLRDRGFAVRCLYLNLMFADIVGIDVNENLAVEMPNHLLIGDWLFARCLERIPRRPEVQTHRQELERYYQARMSDVLDIRDRVAPAFVAEAAGRIMQRRPRIVGFTTMFEQTVASLAIAAEVKRRDPSIVIVFGGANCHGPMGGTLLLHYPQIDYVFTGEADAVFADFVDRILNTGEAAGIVGCLGRQGQAGAAAVPLMDMDSLPIPDYADYHRQLAELSEHDRIRPSTPFESSRGCWWGQKHHCTFCGLNAEGMVFRAKSPKRVLEELDTLGRAYGVHRFAATDNIISVSHVSGVLAKLAESPGSFPPRRLFYEMKSNTDEDDLLTMAKAGLIWVQPGIESLSDAALRIMRKGVKALLNIRFLRNCRELGMGVIWSILYGFPGEPPAAYDDVARMVPLLEHLYPPICCVRIRLDRFSPNYERAAEMGFRDVVPTPAYAAIHDMPDESLVKLAYFFEGYAPNAAREADLVELRRAVVAWRASWFDGPVTPQLTMVAVGGGRLIKDTRRCAVEPLYYADGAEAALLALLRSPCGAAGLPGRLADFATSAVEDALETLLRRQFLVDLDGNVMSLVTEAGREFFEADDRSEAPTGYILARETEPASNRQEPALT